MFNIFKKNKAQHRTYSTNFVPPTKAPPPVVPQKEKAKTIIITTNPDYINLRLTTKDEFILQETMDKLPCDKEHAIKLFDDVSKGHNFIFETDESHLWSVDDIDKLLKR